METYIDKLSENVVQLLDRNKLHIATAESCTGGLVSAAITSVSGASAVFDMGACTYANSAKAMLAYVDEALLSEYGAVSWQVAEAMAAGIARRAGAELGISTTGIAGPTGGTAENPVGTVFIGCSYKGKTGNVHVIVNMEQVPKGADSRAFMREETVRQALILARDTIIANT